MKAENVQYDSIKLRTQALECDRAQINNQILSYSVFTEM